jgi:hypothetical protein
MKQTAVEWIIEEINQQQKKYIDLAKKDKSLKKGVDAILTATTLLKMKCKQAKEMEKQQGYSEEEVIKLLQKALTHKDDGEIGSLVTAQGEIRTANFFSWFNKFKNKK